MLCVKDLLNMESFQDIDLVAGHRGLFHSVEIPVFAIMPEIRPWLTENNVVLVPGIGLDGSAETLNDLLTQADEKHAACMVVLLSADYVPKIPEETLRYADRLHIPLFTAPWEKVLARIIEDVTSALMAERYLEDEVNTHLEALLIYDSTATKSLQGFMERYGLFTHHAVAVVKFPDVELSVRKARQNINTIQGCGNRIIKDIRSAFPNSLYLRRSSQLTFLVRMEPTSGRLFRQLLAKSCADIRALYPELQVHIGVGRVYSDPAEFSKSYQEAAKAVNLCTETVDARYFEDLGIYQLLMDLPDQEKVFQYALFYLKPLLEYDRKNRKDLLKTLEVYLHTNCSMTHTAELLYTHRNTISYQVTRIQDILGCDLEDAEVRNRLFNCLKLYQYSLGDVSFR